MIGKATINARQGNGAATPTIGDALTQSMNAVRRDADSRLTPVQDSIERSRAMRFHTDRVDAAIGTTATCHLVKAVIYFFLVEVDDLGTRRRRHGEPFRDTIACFFFFGVLFFR